MANFTWIGATGASTITADWSPNGSPGPGDTASLTNGGTILLGDVQFQDNTWSLGTGLLLFAGDTLVTLGVPNVDAASQISTNVGSFVAQASTIDALGNFVNEGTILADGTLGSSLTINIGTTVFSGTTAPGYSYNTGLIQADSGNTLTINIGASSELFSSGSIVADGGHVVITASPSAIAGGYAAVGGFDVVEGGGTLETQASYPLINGSQPGGSTARFEFGDTTPGNTIKIDNLGSFGGAFTGFQAGDTVDLGTLIAISTLVFSGTTGLLELENATGTVLASMYLTTDGMVTSGTFAVSGGTADGLIFGTGADGDTVVTTNRTFPSSNNVSGIWQNASSWNNFQVPGTTDTAFIGAVATAGTPVNNFSLTTGVVPVSVGGISMFNANATLTVNSNTNAEPGIVNDYAGTLIVEGGNTLTSSALRTFSPQTSVTVDAGATVDLTGRPGSSLAATAGTIAITNSNSGAVEIAAGTLVIDGALLAGPPTPAGGGGNFTIGQDSSGAPATVIVNGDGTSTDGQITDTYALLGSDPTSSGTLTLNGPGASWTDTIDQGDTSNNRGYMIVGFNNMSTNTPAGLALPPAAQAAQLVIENGAVLTDQQSAQIADSINSAGNVTVAAGGFWNLAADSSFVHNGTTVTNVNTGFVNVGLAGSGSLSVLSGGSVAIGGLETYLNNGTIATGGGIGVGRSATAAGTVIVSGAGSQLSSLADGMAVGESGQGLLSIVNGGTVLLSAGGGMSVGATAGAASSGTIDIGGPGAAAVLNFAAASGSVAAAGGISVGAASQGTLNVSDNGTFNLNGTGFLTVGSTLGAVGSIVVGGTTASAVINLGTEGLTDGFMGAGHVTINSLGTIALSGTAGITMGQSLGATGTMLVSGGRLTEGSTASGITVGQSGTGTLTVNNGGVITMNGTGGIGLANSVSGSGQMTVAGGSVIFNDTTNFGIGVGNSGSGLLTVSDNGIVDINANGVGNGFLGIGNSAGSHGTVVVGGSSAAAVINLGGGGIGVGNSGAGALTVNSLGTVAVTGTAGITVGFTPGAVGTMTVNDGLVTEGASTYGINMANFAGATSSFLIENGGTVSLAGGGINIASFASGANATLTVTGAKALLKSTGNSNVAVGGSGNATLTVSNGGSIAMLGSGGIGVDSTDGTPSQMNVANASISTGATGGFFGVGNSGAGTLTVSDNGVFSISGNGTNGSGQLGIGNGAGSNGFVVVGGTAAAAVIDIAGGGLSMGSDGTGDLTVNKFGTVALTGTAGITVGYSSSASGMLTVNDGLVSAGSASFGINVGFTSNAAGSLLIENGGMVTLAGGGLDLANGPSATGTATVTGAGSTLTDAGFVTVGGSGEGALTVSNGGLVSDGTGLRLGIASGGTGVVTVDNGTMSSVGIDAGQGSGGSGTITVSGTRSLLSSSAFFLVGDSGDGNLSIGTNGTVTAAAGLTIANASGASGSAVNVSGAGSHLGVTGALVVGGSGFGSLSLSQGASVTTTSLDVAAGATGDGVVSLAGAGTTLTITGSLTLGDQAAGELSILGGAQMTIAGGLIGGTGFDGTGNLDIEDNGSQLTINGGTLLVGANGPAEFTLGIGATLDGEVATDPNGVTNEYGNVDPPTLMNDGTENVGNDRGGSSQTDDFFIANSGTINVSGTATFYAPLATFETAAQNGVTTGLWVIASNDTLVMNTTSVDGSQTFEFNGTTAAELVIGQVPSGNINNLDTLNGQTTPVLTASIAPGSPNVLPGWDAPIENYLSGDVIALRGLTYGSATVAGDVVTVWSGGGGTGSDLGSLVFIDTGHSAISSNATNEAQAAAAQINALACFAAGTRIETVDGLVAVETLRVGDLVRTVLGGPGPVGSGPDAVRADALPDGPKPVRSSRGWAHRDAERTVPGGPGRGEALADVHYDRIVWVGSRAVNCARHPKPDTVWPVRVRAGAFGDNVPVSDLYLSPDHAVFVAGVLVPVKLLVNGTSVEQVKRDHVVYYHVELPEHAVILAEGMTVESYLDTGDRASFDGGATIRLFPDFAARSHRASSVWETHGCARIVITGPELAITRHRLEDRTRLLRRQSNDLRARA